MIGNTAASTGGGIGGLAAAGSSCRVYGGLVAGNTAPEGGGASYSFFYGGTVFSNNTATTKGGGGIESDNSRFVSNAVFVCNTATAGVGGAAYGGTLVGCEIFGNRAINGGGVAGSICESCTIADNLCEKMFISTSTEGATEVVNCIFAGNRNASGEARNLWYDKATYNKIRLQNCLIGSGRNPAVAPPYEEANTVTNDNAKFVKDGSRDAYALKRSSPAIGKGLIQDWMTDVTDIRQDPACPRLRDGKVDIGCYQCWLDPVGMWFSIR